MKWPRTLAARIGLITGSALILFVLLTGLLLFRYILMPVGRQAADDLAALIVLSARTWVELPPPTRPLFEEELALNHDLTLTAEPPPVSLAPLSNPPPYLRFLEEALARRLGEPVRLQVETTDDERYWGRISLAGRTLHFGFTHDRVGARPPLVFLGVLAGAGLFLLVTTLLLVRLVNRPLERLAAAAEQLGQRGSTRPLPESGPRELALLARRFNLLSGQVHRLLENRTVLLGGLSHDLRTPLARMSVALELLGTRCDPAAVSQLRRDLAEMEDLVARTLELARALQAEPAELEPVDALAEALVSEHRARGRDLVLERQGATCSRPVPALPLRRILDNLLENAFRYAPGRVTLALACEETVRLCVLDHGPGIPPEALEAVFEPFHRLEPSRSTATGGSGLGLAIVRQLAELQGWRVFLENRSGGGLAACVELPPSPQGQVHAHAQAAEGR